MKNQGQSTLEFLFSFVFSFSLIFLFVKMALNYTNGFLVHYATFMASRSYMVLDTNSRTPEGSDSLSKERAIEVFKNNYYLSKFLNGVDLELKFNDPEFQGNKLYVGPYVEYADQFSLSPLFGGGIKLNLKSESFLGKEPTRAECLSRICYAIGQLGVSCSVHATLADNGC